MRIWYMGRLSLIGWSLIALVVLAGCASSPVTQQPTPPLLAADANGFGWAAGDAASGQWPAGHGPNRLPGLASAPDHDAEQFRRRF